MSQEYATQRQSGGVTRRRFLTGASALASAGWVAGSAGGWLLRPERASAATPIKVGIATISPKIKV